MPQTFLAARPPIQADDHSLIWGRTLCMVGRVIFASLNDQHCHAVEDRALVRLARLIRINGVSEVACFRLGARQLSHDDSLNDLSQPVPLAAVPQNAPRIWRKQTIEINK